VKCDGSFKGKAALSKGKYRLSKIDTWENAASVTLGLAALVLSFASNLNIKTEDFEKFTLIWGGATATDILVFKLPNWAPG
jgi:hypothetical protein